jgi:hypothetical protein
MPSRGEFGTTIFVHYTVTTASTGIGVAYGNLVLIPSLGEGGAVEGVASVLNDYFAESPLIGAQL